jgi:hypothetical protein
VQRDHKEGEGVKKRAPGDDLSDGHGPDHHPGVAPERVPGKKTLSSLAADQREVSRHRCGFLSRALGLECFNRRRDQVLRNVGSGNPLPDKGPALVFGLNANANKPGGGEHALKVVNE